MMGKELFDRPAQSYAEGLLSYRAQWLRFSRKDREDLVAYLAANFGPGAKPRNVRTDKETPLDEAKLAKAIQSIQERLLGKRKALEDLRDQQTDAQAEGAESQRTLADRQVELRKLYGALVRAEKEQCHKHPEMRLLDRFPLP